MNKYLERFCWDNYNHLVSQYDKLYQENKVLKKEIEDLKEIDKQICNEELLTQEYIQNNYIKKDKIRESYYKICASVNHFESKNDNNIVLRIKKYLEKLLEE